MKMIFVCSPYRGDIEGNIARAHRYCRFVARSEAVPMAPHTIFTQWLDDNDKEEREAGIYLGLEVLSRCDEVWVFGRHITEGMSKEITTAYSLQKPILYFNEKCEMIIDPRGGN